jgi:hypothetical protein
MEIANVQCKPVQRVQVHNGFFVDLSTCTHNGGMHPAFISFLQSKNMQLMMVLYAVVSWWIPLTAGQQKFIDRVSDFGQ